MKTTAERILRTVRQLLKHRRTLAIFAALYAALLATLYGFVSTREATVWQVLLTLVFVVLTPLAFFALQAAIVDHGLNGRVRWHRALSNAGKLAVVTLPIILLGVVLFVVLNRWQLHFPAHVIPTSSWPADGTWPVSSHQTATQPLHWPALIFSTLRWLLFGVSLPLITIHLWIEAGRNNLRAFVRGGVAAAVVRVGRIVARAFAPESVLTYTLGLILFALIPYTLLFVHIPAQGTRTDFAVFIARLALVFLLTLFGWVLTITTLARNAREDIGASDEDENAFVGLALHSQN